MITNSLWFAALYCLLAVLLVTFGLAEAPQEDADPIERDGKPGAPNDVPPPGHIKAEVEGILGWKQRRNDNDEGSGYFIRLESADDRKGETRVWLVISEDKVTAPKLQGLVGKRVAATGLLQQLRTGIKWSVPPGGMYFTKFEIDAVKPKSVK